MTNDSNSDGAERMYRVDRYTVPKASLDEFAAGALKMREFLRTLEGFVQQLVLEKEADRDTVNVITVTEWANMEAIRKAVVSVRNMHQQAGSDRQSNLQRLGIALDQSEYKPVAR